MIVDVITFYFRVFISEEYNFQNILFTDTQYVDL